jgi:hypothetical protein
MLDCLQKAHDVFWCAVLYSHLGFQSLMIIFIHMVIMPFFFEL